MKEMKIRIVLILKKRVKSCKKEASEERQLEIGLRKRQERHNVKGKFNRDKQNITLVTCLKV